MGHSITFGASALGLLFEQFAEAGRVVYTPANGLAVSLAAIIGKESVLRDESHSGQSRRLRRQVKILLDPSSSYGGVAKPRNNAGVTVDGVAYTIDTISVLSGHAVLGLVRTDSAESSRPDYRRPWGNPRR